MKITANLYMDDESETPIFSMYDLSAVPFNVGDEIHLSVEDLYPAQYNKYREDTREKFINDNTELRKTFDLTTIQITKLGRYVRFTTLNEGSMTLEYHCKIVKDLRKINEQAEVHI
jgi:hypothetical protein